MLAVVLFDDVNGVSPAVVIPAIIRTLPGYLLSCGVMAGLVVVWLGYGQLARLPVPIIGPVLATCVSLYLMMVVARVCGVIYCCNEDRLGWFPAD